jgi:hypothetical protein
LIFFWGGGELLKIGNIPNDEHQKIELFQTIIFLSQILQNVSNNVLKPIKQIVFFPSAPCTKPNERLVRNEYTKMFLYKVTSPSGDIFGKNSMEHLPSLIVIHGLQNYAALDFYHLLRSGLE